MNNFSRTTSRFYAIFCWFLAFYAGLAWMLIATGPAIHHSLHLMLDTANGMLSLMLAVFLLSEQYELPTRLRLYLALAFGISAATEIMHGLTGLDWTGPLAWIGANAHQLRPATWPPSTYFLPIALLTIHWLIQRNSTLSPSLFTTLMVSVTILLYLISFQIPPYIDTGLLEIHRPTQIPLLILWAVVIRGYWQLGSVRPIYKGIAYLGILLLLSDFSMLFSTSPSEKFAIIAHIGKLTAYTFLHLILLRSVAEDTTARTTAEDALRISNERLSIALQGATDGLWDWNLETNKVYYSPRWKEMLGYNNDELQNHLDTWASLVDPAAKGPVLEKVAACAEGDTSRFEVEFRMRHKDGHWVDILSRGMLAKDKAGNLLSPQRLIGTHVDISNLKNVQRELEKSRQRAQEYLNIAQIMLIVVDHEGRIQMINRKGCEMLRLSEPDLLGKKWIDHFIPHSAQEDVRTVFSQLMDGQQDLAAYHENIVLTGSGEERLFAWNNSLLKNEDGQIVGVLSSAEDITDRKQMELEAQALREQLLQATEMEAVGQLTAGIAHDFNNILGSISGYAELSQHMIAAGKPDEVNRYLTQLLGATTRAKELILQMLTFSRLQTGTSVKDSPTILLAPVIEEVVTMLQSSIPATIQIHTELTEQDVKANIKAVNLNQILLNLCINARDAIGEYGEISIELSKASDTNQVCDSCGRPFSGDYAAISVHDTGTGIPKEALEKIFDPFFTTKDVGKGTGMGLSVVHGLVHAVGGHIRVESSKDHGSSICIMLPLERESKNTETLEAVVTTTPVVDTENLLVGKTIMVVDDVPLMLSLLTEYLTTQGATPMPFQEPLKALEAFEKNPEAFDLVITDETMPGLTGMDLAKRMLALRPNLPIILCTGYSEHAIPETVAAIGVAAYFQKPVQMNELMRKAKTLLAGASDESPST